MSRIVVIGGGVIGACSAYYLSQAGHAVTILDRGAFGAGWIPWSADENNIFESIPRMREAVASFGRDPADVQIAGKLPIVAGPDGQPAIGPSVEAVVPLLDAGVTDIRALLPVPDELHAAEDYLTPWVQAFREVAKR